MIIALFEMAFCFVDLVFLVGVGAWNLLIPSVVNPPLSHLSLIQPPHWSLWVQIGNQTTKILEPTSTHVIPCLELFHCIPLWMR